MIVFKYSNIKILVVAAGITRSLHYCRTVCSLVLCSSVTLFSVPLSVSASNRGLDEGLDSKSWDCFGKIIQLALRLLFFIIKYWSNNLATKTERLTLPGSFHFHTTFCIGQKQKTNWPHTAVPNSLMRGGTIEAFNFSEHVTQKNKHPSISPPFTRE